MSNKYWRLKISLTITLVDEAFERLEATEYGTEEYHRARRAWLELMELVNELG